jgi:hypothetical protein
MKNAAFCGVTTSAFVITDVSKKLMASIIRGTRIGDLGTTLAVSS